MALEIPEYPWPLLPDAGETWDGPRRYGIAVEYLCSGPPVCYTRRHGWRLPSDYRRQGTGLQVRTVLRRVAATQEQMGPRDIKGPVRERPELPPASTGQYLPKDDGVGLGIKGGNGGPSDVVVPRGLSRQGSSCYIWGNGVWLVRRRDRKSGKSSSWPVVYRSRHRSGGSREGFGFCSSRRSSITKTDHGLR